MKLNFATDSKLQVLPVEKPTQKKFALVVLYKRISFFMFSITGSIFSYITTNTFKTNIHAKLIIHHCGNPDYRLVVRCIRVGCRKFDPHPHCAGHHFFVAGNYQKSIVLSFSHIHGPFYQQGYSSPL
jgi:hypothetical protein